jgi:hypothetical protein
MKAERFYTLVEERLGGGCHAGVLAEDEAALTAHVVLAALGRCLDRQTRLRLAQELPRRLAVDLMFPGVGEPDLVTCVACELQIDPDLAARRIRSVVEALREYGASVPNSLASLTP